METFEYLCYGVVWFATLVIVGLFIQSFFEEK